VTYKDIDEARRAFDASIDSAADVTVMGYELTPSRALKALEPIGYRLELSTWLEGQGVVMEDLDGWGEAEL